MREAVGRWARAKLASGLVVGWNGGRGREGGKVEAVQRCKSAKVNVSGLVVGWAGGMGVEEEARGGGKVDRKNKGTGGLVDWWARRTGRRDTGISGKVQKCKGR